MPRSSQLLIKFLRRVPGIRRLRELFRNPRKEMKALLHCAAFLLKHPHLRAAPATPPHRKVLVVSFMGDNAAGAQVEAFFAKALQLGGGRCFIVTNRGCWANLVYRAFGGRDMVFFEDFWDRSADEAARIEEASREAAASAASLPDLMEVSFEGVAVGKYVASTLLRRTHSAEIDFDDQNVRAMARRDLKESMATALAAKKTLEAVAPDTVLFLEKGYSPFGEFFDLALSRGLDVLQWMGSHTSKAFVLKRYFRSNRGMHPSTLSKATWDMLKAAPRPEELSETAKSHLREVYGAGEWFSEVGTQFNTSVLDREALRSRLGLRPGKKLAVIFAHIFWDATFFTAGICSGTTSIGWWNRCAPHAATTAWTGS